VLVASPLLLGYDATASSNNVNYISEGGVWGGAKPLLSPQAKENILRDK